jgi:Lrp/AsnC family leucine-responsive transcriptional regulator
MSDLDQLDETNRLLLRELHADPRITMSALARKVGMSAPAVTERAHRRDHRLQHGR